MNKVKLQEVCNFLNGYAFKSKLYVNNGIRVLRISNVQQGKIVDNDPCFYPFETSQEINKYLLNQNDMLISLTGNVGRSGIVTKDLLPAALNQRVSCMRIKDENILTYKFLFYYFQQKSFINECIKASSGVAQLNLSTKWLEQYEIPLPPFSEQNHIVEKLDELFSELDNGIETLQKTKSQLKVYRQAVLKDAFEGIGEFIILGDISISRLGKMLDKQKNKGELKTYLRNINVRWLSFNLEDLLEMKIEEDEYEKFSIKTNDLVICEGGEPGRCAIWKYEDTIFYQKALHRVRFKDNCEPKLYMYYFWFLAQSGGLESYFTGTGIKHLTGESLKKVLVPKCSIDRQQQIVQEIESRLSICDQIEKSVDESLRQAESLRQSILKQAFEGRLV